MTKHNSESGRTMLEMLGVLAIMGVIMYGAIAGIQFGVEIYKISATYNDLEELAQGITDLYSWSRGYPQDNDKMITAVAYNNIIEAEPRAGGFAGRFGGSTVAIGSVSSRDDGIKDQFYITVNSLSASQCRRLKTKMSDSSIVRVLEATGAAPVVVGASPTSCSDSSNRTNILTVISR